MEQILQSIEKWSSCVLAVQYQSIIPRNVQWACGKDWFTTSKEEQVGWQTWLPRAYESPKCVVKEDWNKIVLDTQPPSYTEI